MRETGSSLEVNSAKQDQLKKQNRCLQINKRAIFFFFQLRVSAFVFNSFRNSKLHSFINGFTDFIFNN